MLGPCQAVLHWVPPADRDPRSSLPNTTQLYLYVHLCNLHVCQRMPRARLAEDQTDRRLRAAASQVRHKSARTAHAWRHCSSSSAWCSQSRLLASRFPSASARPPANKPTPSPLLIRGSFDPLQAVELLKPIIMKKISGKALKKRQSAIMNAATGAIANAGNKILPSNVAGYAGRPTRP